MNKSKFSKFLISALALTAFLAGYLIIGGGLGDNSRKITGTVLDKFDGQTDPANDRQKAEESTGIRLLTDRPVVSIVNSQGKESVLYYEKNTGKVFEFDLTDRKEEVVSDAVLANFISSLWSPTQMAVISTFYSSSGSIFKHHDFNTKKTTELGSDVKSVAFSPDGSLIVYYLFEGQPTTPASSVSPTIEGIDESGQPEFYAGKIIISEPDGKYQKKVLDTRLRDVVINWPAKNQITLKTPLSDLFLLTEDGKLNKLLEFKTLLEERWSKSGKKLLFSSLTDISMEPVLFITNVETREEKPLNLEGSASKCTWSIDDVNIFCALAKSPSVDDIYQINTLDGSKKLVAEPGFTIKEVLLSGLEDHLLFVSVVDEKLYGIEISN